MISVTCGSTASQDQDQASTLLKAYCHQDWQPEFPKPKHPVSLYIDEILAMTELAPCASIRLSGIINQQVVALTYSPVQPTNNHQTEAIFPYLATDLAPCVCEKNQNSHRVSEMTNSTVESLCSSNKDNASENHSPEKIQRNNGMRLDVVAAGGGDTAPLPYEEGPSGAMPSRK